MVEQRKRAPRRIDRSLSVVSLPVALDFSIDVTGFEMGEIDVMIEDLAPASRGKDDPADATPEQNPRSREPVTCGFWTVTASTAAMPETGVPIPR